MTETVFNQQTPAVPSTEQTPTIPPEVAEFVGAGKKYADVSVALQSIPHAQTHISKLEAELAAMKEEITKRRTAEELVEEFRKTGTVQTPATTSAAVDPAQVVQLIDQVITQKTAQVTAAQNTSSVVDAFKKAHGEAHAEQKYIELAKTVGLSINALNRLSAESPEAVLKLAGLNKAPATPTTPLQSGVNTESLTTPQTQELSARVGKSSSTKDIVAKWKVAGEKVKQTQA